MANPTAVAIPVLELSQAQGLLLLQDWLNTTIDIEFVERYNLYSGTSMSAPHVTGAIAKVWRACPRCNHVQVRDCFFATAQDLGAPGHDIQYGHGMVRMKMAHNCLRKGCCGRKRRKGGRQRVLSGNRKRRERRRQQRHSSLVNDLGETLTDMEGPTWTMNGQPKLER